MDCGFNGFLDKPLKLDTFNKILPPYRQPETLSTTAIYLTCHDPKSSPSLLLILRCALTLSMPASQAQELSSRLEELVVTAQKRDESLLEVPIAIDVIGQDFIENSGAQGLSDLEYAVPSVNFGRGERKTRGEITIRGVGDFSATLAPTPELPCTLMTCRWRDHPLSNRV